MDGKSPKTSNVVSAVLKLGKKQISSSSVYSSSSLHSAASSDDIHVVVPEETQQLPAEQAAVPAQAPTLPAESKEKEPKVAPSVNKASRTQLKRPSVSTVAEAEDDSSEHSSGSNVDVKLLPKTAETAPKAESNPPRQEVVNGMQQLSPGKKLDLSASAPSLKPLSDKIIIKQKGNVSPKETASPLKLSAENKALSASSPNMSGGYERFDKPNGTAESPAAASESFSAESSGEVRIEIPRPARQGAANFYDADTSGFTHGFISDPGGSNLQNMSSLEVLRYRIRCVVEHIGFRLFTVLLILLDLVLVIIDLSISNCVSSNNVLEIISHTIITFFLLEVFLRIFAKGKSFFLIILDVIDMVVVVISFIIDMVFLGLSPESCEEKETDQTAYARLIVIGRVVRIIRIARILYIAYTQRRHVSAATRQLVSQNKRRYQKDGFDLDLCYITERVIAMSFPSKGLMAVYRNPVEEVARFFNTKHKDHYKIYNLCSERDYDEELFMNNVERIYIDDHNVPKVREMLTFCDNVRAWMAADPANVIAIHCKGGKGRTGTMICIWLLECGVFEEAKTSLEYFGDRRTDLTKGKTFQGVETPSQSRYVGYFEKMKTEFNRTVPPRKVLKIKSFKIVGIGKVGNGDGSDLFIELRQDNLPIFECNMGTGVNCKVIKFPDTDSIVIELVNCPNVEGDIKVMFKTHNKKIPIGYDKCPFFFWFYTSFIEDNKLFLEREELDNPHKAKTHHAFGENFSVTINFESVDMDNL